MFSCFSQTSSPESHTRSYIHQDFTRRVSKESTFKAKDFCMCHHCVLNSMCLFQLHVFVQYVMIVLFFPMFYLLLQPCVFNKGWLIKTYQRFSPLRYFTQTLGQKQAQLDIDGHMLLHDCCVLWIWIKNKMVDLFPGEVLQQHDAWFEQGFLGYWLLHARLQILDIFHFFT